MTKRRAAKAKEAGSQAEALDSEDLFEMANLFPRTTGLPTIVWENAGPMPAKVAAAAIAPAQAREAL